MDEEFDRLVDEFVQWLVETNPIVGTILGLHEYDHLLPDGSREAHLKEIEEEKEFIGRLEELDPEKLSFQKRIERDALIGIGHLSIFGAEEYRQWESRPVAVDALGGSVLRLFTMDFAPLKDRLLNITSRIEKAPKFLEESKTRIIKPVKLWVETQIQTSKGFPVFLDEIYKVAEDVMSESELERLREAIERAKESLLDYEKWMEEELLPRSEEEYRMGKEQLDKSIELKRLGLSTDEIRALGEKYLSQFRKQLEELAEIIKPGASVEEVREQVRSNHPESFDQVMEEYRDSIKESRRFIEENDLIDIPPGEELKVVETPEYLRNTIPFAAYLSPTRFDEKKTGIYIVTPVGDNPNLMKEHSYASIMNTTVHEGYPGHHLQLTLSRMNPSIVPSIIGMSMGATDTVEGWAHYCEEWMKEKGFDDTPEARFLQTIDLIWRAVRIIVDVDLHSKKMDFDQAVDFLLENVGMERPSAEAEVRRYTMYPAYQLCYLIGRHLIMELRDYVKERMGDKYDEEFFHNTFLSAGSIPVFLIRQIFDNKLQAMGFPPQG
jgi:uncharacterized protein (DUF885 family)